MITPDLQEMANHIAVLNEDYTKLSVNVAIVTERVNWLCQFFWLIAGTVITTLAVNVWQLWKMHKE
jgi:hypothetical protein